MRTATLDVVRAGLAQVQDLGRTGFASIGVAANGAGDQKSARLANTLVGNADGAALLEVIASAFEFRARGDILIAVTGAAESVIVDAAHWQARQPIAVPSGAMVSVPEPRAGTRMYIAVNGVIESERVLGSVAPDGMLTFGRRLAPGDAVEVSTGFHASDFFPMPVFRIATPRPVLGSPAQLHATRGPDLHRLAHGEGALGARFEVLPQSDTVGVRCVGGDLALVAGDEILSRGVPTGAVQVPPSGELIILMRGHLVTAGYPVVAVLTRSSIDRLAQVRPGDSLMIDLVDADTARAHIAMERDAHQQIAERVAGALAARGLDRLIGPDHASRS